VKPGHHGKASEVESTRTENGKFDQRRVTQPDMPDKINRVEPVTPPRAALEGAHCAEAMRAIAESKEILLSK
jgi:hypothetical protein